MKRQKAKVESYSFVPVFIEAVRRVSKRKGKNKSGFVFDCCAPHLVREDKGFADWFTAMVDEKKAILEGK